jgi:hypothetical protein
LSVYAVSSDAHWECHKQNAQYPRDLEVIILRSESEYGAVSVTGKFHFDFFFSVDV